MRKRIEQDFSWGGGGWVETNEVHYIYDGNLVLQERDKNNNPLTTYTRGIDVSGSFEGAGGIGGLLARSDNQKIVPAILNSGSANPQNLVTSYYYSDAQGNIAALVSPSGLILAQYEYDPFGNVISKFGLMADMNKYRFSSKEWDENAGLYYYGYRFYDPNLQRWVNRDPMGDIASLPLLMAGAEVWSDAGDTEGGIRIEGLDSWAGMNVNLGTFAANDPLGLFDAYGLYITVNGDQGEFNQACHYLMGDPGMANIIGKLESSSKKYTVNMNDRGDDSYHPMARTINWDPNIGFRTSSGGHQTPALALGHEMGHAQGSALWHALLHAIPSKNYDNQEEKRVITKVETPAAKNLGEGTRTDHQGTAYPVSGPTSCQ